jgi:type II secretory pathway pseudopilin PulG
MKARNDFSMKNGSLKKRGRKQAHGFTLMEVAMALAVFIMMTVMFAAVFPMVARGSQFSGNYSQAAMLAEHKVDQIRSLGFAKLDYNGLNAQGVIDSMTTPPSGLPATYTFTGVDNLVTSGSTTGFFPPGSVGTITVQDYSAFNPSAGIAAGQVDYVTITITWPASAVSGGTYSTSAMVIEMKHT